MKIITKFLLTFMLLVSTVIALNGAVVPAAGDTEVIINIIDSNASLNGGNDIYKKSTTTDRATGKVVPITAQVSLDEPDKFGYGSYISSVVVVVMIVMLLLVLLTL
jgi:hypothetical protein